MKAFAIFFLFIGIILVIHAYYKNMTVCPPQETIIKYVPRSIYEEQLNDEQKLTEFYKVMFDGTALTPPYERTTENTTENTSVNKNKIIET